MMDRYWIPELMSPVAGSPWMRNRQLSSKFWYCSVVAR